jgi:hypothetical protein
MIVYNGFIATNPRLKKSKSLNEGATAGAAKVSSSRGGRGGEELKVLGERKNWTVRELSMREIQQMSAEEVLWHEAYNKENLDRAFTLSENQRLNRERIPVWETRRMWEGKATPEENEKSRIAGDAFAIRHPRFERTIENATLMVEYMRDHDLDATESSSYVTAYRELTDQGKLTVAPTESAHDFLRSHPELQDRRTPPLIQVREAKAAQTAKHFEAAASATAQGTVVNVTDYPSEQSGYPAAPTKYSFRRLLDSLSAEDYQKRLNEDPQFAVAIDKLNNGNK